MLVGQRVDDRRPEGPVDGVIVRRRARAASEPRSRLAPRRPPHRHRRDGRRGARPAVASRRRRRLARRAARARRTTGSPRARSTTGSARTSRSRRRGGSRRPADAPVDVVAVASVQEEVGDTRRPGGRVRPRAGGRARGRRHLGDRRSRRRPRRAGRVELGSGADDHPRAGRSTRRLRAARRGRRGGGDPATRSRSTRGTHAHRCRRRAHQPRGGIPTGLVSIPLRYMHSPCEIGRPRRPRGGDRARRRVRAPAHARDELPALAWTRGPQRHRRRGADAVREARRRPRRATRRPSSARSRSGRRSSARDRAARGRVRDHGPGAAGRRRPGAGAPGGGRRRDADRRPGRHDQQGLRLVDPRGRDRRLDDPRRRRRARRHRRDGVDVERAVRAAAGALRLPARRRDARST